MPKYKVEIDGQNFLINMDGRQAKYGFFMFRLVDADDEAAAAKQAVQMVRDAPNLGDTVLNRGDDAPTIDVLSIVEVVDLQNPQPGLIWYPEQSRRWWEFWKR